MSKSRALAQIAEILGDDNRWFCSQYYKREVTDPRTLCRYFCDHGGAANFAERWDDAMGPTNRWFCSEHYSRDISDDEDTLWAYYMARFEEACSQSACEHEDAVELSVR